MHLTIVNYALGGKNPKVNPKRGYGLSLSAYAGGPILLRTSRLASVEAAKRVAGDLLMSAIPWSDEHPPEDPIRFHVALPFQFPIERVCIGVGVDYPHEHGSLSQCPDCAEGWPPVERKPAQDRSEPLPTSRRPPDAG